MNTRMMNADTLLAGFDHMTDPDAEGGLIGPDSDIHNAEKCADALADTPWGFCPEQATKLAETLTKVAVEYVKAWGDGLRVGIGSDEVPIGGGGVVDVSQFYAFLSQFREGAGAVCLNMAVITMFVPEVLAETRGVLDDTDLLELFATTAMGALNRCIDDITLYTAAMSKGVN